jgi:hypothetical protein
MRKKSILSIAVFFVFIVGGLGGFYLLKLHMEQTRPDFERMAVQLPYLSLQSVLFDRTEHFFKVADPKQREEHFRILRKATDGTYPKEALLDLLTHKDPKVRTLAAVALFDREDPSVLPALVKLCDDQAATFDGYPELFALWLKNTGVGPPPLKQTVGDIVTKMVGFYMKRSGFYYGVKHKTQPGFVEYWEARKNRPYCSGWFDVQLARASQGTMPTRKDRIERIRAVRKRIDKLPADERTWVLLRLNGEAGSDVLATEEELIEACKKVGADKVLLMLQNKIPSDDPDLQPRTNNNWPYQRMALFVLRHAEQLFRPDDSDTLLACERWQRDYQKHGIFDPTITPWWAVAAARLKPGSASQILHAAMDRFQGEYDSDERSTLCIAMWQLAGRSELGFIVDWFYNDLPERGSFPNCRGSFIDAMGKAPNGREIISRLIQDTRLDDIDWQSLERLVRVVNGWSETPIVPEEELQKAWHPLGQGHFYWSQSEADQKYPKETSELRMHLSEWRERLRMSIPKLSGGDRERRNGTIEQDAPTAGTGLK